MPWEASSATMGPSLSRCALILVEHAPLVEEGPAALARASRPALDFEPLRALVRRLLALPWEPDPARLEEVRGRIAKLEARGAPPLVLEPQRRTLAALSGAGRDPARADGASPHDLRRWLVELAVHERAGWDLLERPGLLDRLAPGWRTRDEPAGPLERALLGAGDPPEVLRGLEGDRYSPPDEVARAADALDAVDGAGWPAALAGELVTLRTVLARARRAGQGLLVRLR